MNIEKGNTMTGYRTIVIVLVSLFIVLPEVFAQSDRLETARRHMVRGTAAIEMAHSEADFAIAAKEFRRATEIAPEMAIAWYNLGAVEGKLGNFAEAIGAYRKYLDLRPKADDTQKVRDEIVKLEFRQERLVEPGKSFRDCADCPEMVVIAAGSFEMGSATGNDEEQPAHRVTISRPFAMSRFEVSEKEWCTVMGNGAEGSLCRDREAIGVTWAQAKEFVSKLSARTGKRYRLPSEAEWEYACRASNSERDCVVDKPYHHKEWLDAHFGKEGSLPSKGPNAWGLYNMTDGVVEWVEDSWHDNYIGAPIDGTAWTDELATSHVCRGSYSWGVGGVGVDGIRVTFRFSLLKFAGMRIVRSFD